jgi:hypothetical protein
MVFGVNRDKTKSQQYFDAALEEIRSDELDKVIKKMKKKLEIE